MKKQSPEAKRPPSDEFAHKVLEYAWLLPDCILSEKQANAFADPDMRVLTALHGRRLYRKLFLLVDDRGDFPEYDTFLSEHASFTTGDSDVVMVTWGQFIEEAKDMILADDGSYSEELGLHKIVEAVPDDLFPSNALALL
jgi:hypothetical protein